VNVARAVLGKPTVRIILMVVITIIIRLQFIVMEREILMPDILVVLDHMKWNYRDTAKQIFQLPKRNFWLFLFQQGSEL